MVMICLSIIVLIFLLIDAVVASGAGNVTADAAGLAPSWVREPDGRGTWTIIYSSTLTLFLSAWVSLHFNIPIVNEGRRRRYMRHGIWGATSFLFPEVIVFIASTQWLQARNLKRELNLLESTSYNIVNGTLKQPFSRIYAWYAQMGGFCLNCDCEAHQLKNFISERNARLQGYITDGILTLKPKGVLELARYGQFFSITDEDIQDKSKADWIAKTLLYVQVVWFVCQVAQRKVADLPLSLLEFHVIVNIGCALVIYSVWFDKPRNVDTPTIEEARSLEQLTASILSKTRLGLGPKLFVQPANPTEDKDEQIPAAIWMCVKGDFKNYDSGDSAYTVNTFTRRDFTNNDSILMCVASPTSMHDEAHRALGERLKSTLLETSRKKKRRRNSPEAQTEHALDQVFSFIRMPKDCFGGYRRNFSYVEFLETLGSSVWMAVNITIFVLALSSYGALHLIPDLLDFSFPTVTERMLWNASCYIVVASLVGAPMTLLGFLSINRNWLARRFCVLKKHESLKSLFDSILALVAATYPAALIFARLYLMVESYLALRKERAEIFLTPNWNWLDYIPHI